MGSRSQFTCLACRYSAEVSGGDDCGMEVRTTTVFCEDCKELSDIFTGYHPWREEAAQHRGEKPPEFRCERSRKHKIRRWTAADPCPKCGGKMENEGATVLWD